MAAWILPGARPSKRGSQARRSSSTLTSANARLFAFCAMPPPNARLRGGGLVAYTIVGAPALGSPSGRVTRLNGYELRTFRLAGRTVVTWRRAGHTCVISAARVPVTALEQLAGWRAIGTSD